MSEQEQEITSTKPAITADQLVVHDDGQFATLFDTARFNQAWRVAKAFADSKMVPSHFQGNTAGVFVILQMATRMELDVFMVLQNMYMVKGKPGMETKLALALVNTRGPFKDPITWEFDNEVDPKECTAFAFLKSTGERREYKLTWDTVKKEGWLDKDGSKWKTLPKLMLMYRSAIFLIRTVCPEVILGLSTYDELQDIETIEAEIIPIPSEPETTKTEKLKAKLKKGKEPLQITPEGPGPETSAMAQEEGKKPVTAITEAQMAELLKVPTDILEAAYKACKVGPIPVKELDAETAEKVIS